MTQPELIEHAMRILPRYEAELLVLQADAVGWRCSIGIYASDLGADLLTDGTPLHSVLTGRTCREDWRNITTPRPGCAWEELQFLRLMQEHPTATDPLLELEDRLR